MGGERILTAEGMTVGKMLCDDPPSIRGLAPLFMLGLFSISISLVGFSFSLWRGIEFLNC